MDSMLQPEVNASVIDSAKYCWAVCAFELVISASLSWIVWLRERTESVIARIKIFRGNRSIPRNGRVERQ